MSAGPGSVPNAPSRPGVRARLRVGRLVATATAGILRVSRGPAGGLGRRAALLGLIVALMPPASAQVPPIGPAEVAMSAYVACLNARLERLKSSCEPVMVVAGAAATGCQREERRLAGEIAPFFRFPEEAMIGIASIRKAQTERLAAQLIEYRLTVPCPPR